MTKATIEIPEKGNRILEIVKGLYGFSNREEAINFVIQQYGKQIVKKEIKESYIKKAKKIMEEKTIPVEDFEKKYL